MKRSFGIRTEWLTLVVAVMEFGYGLGIYVWPVRFQTPFYAWLVPHSRLFSALMLAGGAILFLQTRYRLPAWWQRLLFLVPAGALGWLAYGFAIGRNWPFASAAALIGVGTLFAPWLPRPEGGAEYEIHLAVALLGLAEIGAGILMLLAPGTYNLSGFASLRPHLLWVGLLGLAGGLVLLLPVPERMTSRYSWRWLFGAAFLGVFGWFLSGPAASSGAIMIVAWLVIPLARYIPGPAPGELPGLVSMMRGLLGEETTAAMIAYQEILSWMLVTVVAAALVVSPGDAIQTPLLGPIFMVAAVLCNVVLNWLLAPVVRPKKRLIWHALIHIALLGILFTDAGSIMQPLLIFFFLFPVGVMEALGINPGRVTLGVSTAIYIAARLFHEASNQKSTVSVFAATLTIALVLVPMGELVFRTLQRGREGSRSLRRQLDQSAMMARIATAVHNSLDIGQILATTAPELGQAMKADRCFIFAKPDGLTPPLLCLWTEGQVVPYSDPNPELVGFAKSLLQGGRTAAISDLQAEPWRSELGQVVRQRQAKTQVRSLLLTPVSIGEKMVGAVGCTAGPDCREWLAEEISFIEAVALEVGNALAHAQTHRELAYVADHDNLTGLENRRRFQLRLEAELARCREQGSGGAMLFLDLDQFKYVNDTMGHPAGDALLVGIGTELSRLVADGQALARVGGDEFAVLMPGAGQAAAELLAGEIRDTVRRRVFQVGGRSLSTTISLGVVLYPEHGPSADDLLARADIAVYQAKEQGRDQYQIYRADSSRQEAMKAQVDWEQRVKAALAEDRLLAYGQPILHLESNQVSAYELLVRMVDEEGRILPPADFLDAAERSSLIREIDRWMITAAIGLAKRIQQAGHGLPLHVNLSGKTLTDPGLLPFVQEELESMAVAPQSLIFEITETVIVSDMPLALAQIQALRALGCRFALDDFGSGFSSFSHLLSLPLDHLKIDGRFVQNLSESQQSQAFVRAVVAFGRSLHMQVTAEFVEREETARLLHTYGVNYAQGYLVGRPVPISTLEAEVAD